MKQHLYSAYNVLGYRGAGLTLLAEVVHCHSVFHRKRKSKVQLTIQHISMC